jgi:hypothetical protein
MSRGNGEFDLIGGSVNITNSINPLPVVNATASNQAVNLGQVSQVSPAFTATGLGNLGANGSWNVSVSFTAPCAGYVYAIGALNVASQAAAGISVSLLINGASVSSDNTILTQYHQGVVSVTSGESVTVETLVTSGSTAPNVSATARAGAFFLPNP